MITLINIYTNRVKYLFNVILRLLQENELKKNDWNRMHQNKAKCVYGTRNEHV